MESNKSTKLFFFKFDFICFCGKIKHRNVCSHSDQSVGCKYFSVLQTKQHSRRALEVEEIQWF